MRDDRCKNCANYIQHFALLENKFRKVYCGHCRLSVKNKIKPDSLACDEFVRGLAIDEKNGV